MILATMSDLTDGLNRWAMPTSARQAGVDESDHAF